LSSEWLLSKPVLFLFLPFLCQEFSNLIVTFDEGAAVSPDGYWGVGEGDLRGIPIVASAMYFSESWWAGMRIIRRRVKGHGG